MLDTALHLLFPKRSNSFKAKLIRFEGLLTLSIFLVIFQSLLNFGSKHTSILGYAANISVDEVIRLTNVERSNNGLSTLVYNSKLAEAAKLKGQDMLSSDYWAHVSPSGTEPWDFFNQVGYSYRYAGENLARDFSDPSSAVAAWMASPSHKENILSDKYQEIGIAVVEGDMNGEDTTIIVQLFGTSAADRLPAVPIAQAEETQDAQGLELGTAEVKAEEPVTVQVQEQVQESPELTNAISPFITTKNVSLGVLAVVFFVLIADFLYIEMNGITRKSSRTIAHLSFFVMIAIILFLAKAGEII